MFEPQKAGVYIKHNSERTKNLSGKKEKIKKL